MGFWETYGWVVLLGILVLAAVTVLCVAVKRNRNCQLKPSKQKLSQLEREKQVNEALRGKIDGRTSDFEIITHNSQE